MYEAWGIPHPDSQPVQPAAPIVSAKKVQLIERELATSSVRGDLQPDSKAMIDQEEDARQESLIPQILDYLKLFAEEIDEYRNETMRRNLIYLSIVGVFFAIMIMYIERLNRQIYNLNNILHLHHWHSSNSRLP